MGRTEPSLPPSLPPALSLWGPGVRGLPLSFFPFLLSSLPLLPLSFSLSSDRCFDRCDCDDGRKEGMRLRGTGGSGDSSSSQRNGMLRLTSTSTEPKQILYRIFPLLFLLSSLPPPPSFPPFFRAQYFLDDPKEVRRMLELLAERSTGMSALGSNQGWRDGGGHVHHSSMNSLSSLNAQSE